ncbi:DUF805 domain-containing protein [Campylobacter sp. RM16192]|uniref:DUF805 domain-containing protein n=1 Tax=Campylobacter sp. RM16192 TaxID=1660080 RepID=UPI001451FB61|nr:DUF805 domain-containing protein [Campylobacter sp. RM16192]QCD52101.1 hypothetical membrane protein (DUF805 domain) [Campylobacter sp. RM16192]
MTFSQSIKNCFSNYATFNGRASRSEYWWFALFNVLIYIFASIIDTTINSAIFYTISALALFLPTIAVSVRRLHDINKSGWFYLLFLIPVIGAIILLIWFTKRGTIGPNQFGDDPILE